tara:strand:- start:189 stop:1211 length:1023 start_codon:yes stop_codon:yes gene_type:complete
MDYRYTPQDIQDQINSLDLSKLKKPEYPGIPNVKVIDIKLINIKGIETDDVKWNESRFHGTDPRKIIEIERYFQEFGYKPDERLPAVYYPKSNSSGEPRKTNGFHRDDVCERLGINQYPHAILEFSGTEEEQRLAKRRVALYDNSPVHTSPKNDSTEKDIFHGVVKSVDEKLIPNTKKSVESEVLLCDPSRKLNNRSLKRIASLVMNTVDTPDREILYSTDKAIDWKYQYARSESWEFGWEIDIERNMYGILVGDNQDYIDRSIFRALELYIESGRKTYIIAYVDAPTKNKTIPEKRIDFRNKVNKRINLLKKSGVKYDYIEILGFLPQIRKVENWGKLV